LTAPPAKRRPTKENTQATLLNAMDLTQQQADDDTGEATPGSRQGGSQVRDEKKV
jgi:hypothetical protein